MKWVRLWLLCSQESVFHAVQSAVATDPETALLTVDQAKAFIIWSRSAVFEAVEEHVPALLPFVMAFGAAIDFASSLRTSQHPSYPVQNRGPARRPAWPLVVCFSLFNDSSRLSTLQ